MSGNIDNGYSVIPISESSIQTESLVEVQPAIVGDSENIKMTEQLNGEMPIAISSIQKPSVLSLQLDKKNDVNAQSNSAALSLALDSDSNTVSEITEAEPIFVTSHIDLKETEQKLNAETEIEADIEEEIEESHSEIDQLPSKADNSVVEKAFLDQSILNITKPAVNDETLPPDQSIVNSAKEEAKEETPLEIQNMETQIVQINFEDTTKISITLKSPSISNSANEIEEDIKIELNKDADSCSKKLGDSISSPVAHAAVEVPIVSHSENVKNTQVTKRSKIPAHLIDKIQDDIFAGLFTPDIPPLTALNFESPLVEMKAIVDKKDNSLSNSLGLSNIESNSFGLSNIKSNATKVYSPSHSILADNARKPKVNYSEEIEDERLYALQLITRKLYGILPRDALHIAAPAIEWESFLDIKEVSRSVINLISCSIQEAMESQFEKHNKYAAYSENKFLNRPIQPKPISTDELIKKCHRTVEQWIKDTTRAKNPADILVAEAVKSHGRKLCDMTQDKATLLSKIEQSIWDSLMDDTVDTVMQLYAGPEYEGTNDAIDESLLKQVNDSNTSAKLVELSAASIELDALCVLESVMEKLGILVPLDMQHNQVPNINWETMFAFDHVNPLIVSLISTSIQDSMESQLQIHQEYLAKKRTGGRRRSCPPVAISTSQLLSQCFEHSKRAIKAAFQNSLL
ncbi:hypothetical protein HDV02_002498 [Globomyces sp. JEL0801]|nr:hypothetical protein HDV02_002498 [Globomyces sp. JEL0801]